MSTLLFHSAHAARIFSAFPLAGENGTDVQTDTEEVVGVTVDVLGVLLGVGIGTFVALVLSFVLQGVLTYLGRRRPVLKPTIKAVGRPIKLLFALAGAWVGMEIMWPKEASSADQSLHQSIVHGVIVAFILLATWLLAAFVDGIESAILHQMKSQGESRFRKAQTQLQILHRIVLVAVWILGFALVLMTFPAARALGTTLFTSAGLLSVVLGIAAQSTLGNVFAGLQLAFSDSIRMGDIVIWQKEFTTVEEITLTYVVLKIWDGRRLIVPSSLMTTTTFENWTRRTPDLLGYVDFELDWSVPIDEMRAELERILSQTDLWDGDTGILQVKNAIGQRLQVSALLSAKNASALTDLKYYVREKLVRWIQEYAPESIPKNHGIVTSVGDYKLPEHNEEYGQDGTDATHAKAATVIGDMDETEMEAQAASEPQSLDKQAKARSAAQAARGVSPELSSRAGKAPQLTQSSAKEDKTEKGKAGKSKIKKNKTKTGKINDSHAGAENDPHPTPVTQIIDMSERIFPHRVPIRERVFPQTIVRSEDGSDPNETRVGGFDESGTYTSTMRTPGHESSIFTGSLKAEKRGEEFSGPGKAVLEEREKVLEKKVEKEKDGTTAKEKSDVAATDEGGTAAEDTGSKAVEKGGEKA